MHTLSLSLLGPFAASIEGSPLSNFRTKSVQALLVYMAVEGRSGGLIRRETIAEMLYPGLPPASSKKNLRQTLYELRLMFVAGTVPTDAQTELEPLLLADRHTLGLNSAWTVTLDTGRFENGAKSEDLGRLEETAAVYRGDFLSDFYLPDSSAFEAWAASNMAVTS